MHAHVLTGSPCRHTVPRAACPLCPQHAEAARDEAVSDAAAVVAALSAAHAAGARAVTLRDGDLLARPEALDLLDAARTMGFAAVELWTGSLSLAQAGMAEQVAAAGATHVGLPLYGDAAESHDYVAATPGHFQRTIQALKRTRAAGLRTLVLAPMLRPTYRNLPQLVQKSVAIDVAGFRFVASPGQDRSTNPLLAPLPLTAPYLQTALQRATAARLRAVMLAVPACVLGTYAAQQLPVPPVFAAIGLQEGLTPLAPVFVQGKPCEACTWRLVCPGQLGSLAAQHGWVGLVARADAPPQ